jgi:hypothetical protein
VNASLFFEVLNGGAVTPEIVWLVLLGVYLFREGRRRGVRGWGWLNLPPSMNLVVAMFVCDLGISLRSATVWAWRRFQGGVGDFSVLQSSLLLAGCALIIVGSLCKIRALTKPDHGDRPWLIALASAIVAILVLLALR